MTAPLIPTDEDLTTSEIAQAAIDYLSDLHADLTSAFGDGADFPRRLSIGATSLIAVLNAASTMQDGDVAEFIVPTEVVARARAARATLGS